MDDLEFQRQSEAAIEALYQKLAKATDSYDFDVETNGGALSIEFEEPRERFVVSPNAPVHQIWVSAHVRSFKLEWDAARAAFILPETGQSLETLLADAVGKRLGEEISL